MKKILIAEDELPILRVISKKLEHSGYAVFTAPNGKEALKILAKEKPDILLLDLIMPEVDGFEVLEQMKKKDLFKETRVIIFSNLGQESDIAHARELGASDFVIKSNISIKSVVEKIESVLK